MISRNSLLFGFSPMPLKEEHKRDHLFNCALIFWEIISQKFFECLLGKDWLWSFFCYIGFVMSWFSTLWIFIGIYNKFTLHEFLFQVFDFQFVIILLLAKSWYLIEKFGTVLFLILHLFFEDMIILMSVFEFANLVKMYLSRN